MFKFKAARDPRGILMMIYGALAGMAPVGVGLSMAAGQPIVRSAVYGASGVAFFFLFRAEMAQRKAEHRQRIRAAEAMEFARQQRRDISHGEATQEMMEFIRQQLERDQK